MRYYVILLALCLGVASCTNGVTVTTLIKDFSCFKEHKYVYAIVRAYINLGQVDPNAKATLLAAEQYKLLYADIYVNPCVSCKMKPEAQIDQVVEALKGAKYSTMWLKVQLMDKWTANTTYNCEYINAMVNEAQKLGKSAGIGSEASVWENIMGKDCQIKADNIGCWWQKHDKEQSLDHFKPFGGFTFPTIKEFDGPSKMCAEQVNLNFCNC